MKLTVGDAAALLSVPEKTVWRWIEGRELPAHRLSGQVRLNRSELLEWATANGIHVDPALFREKDAEEGPAVSFADALAAGGVHVGVPGETPEEILRAVAGNLPLPEGVERETLVDFLLAREAFGSTGIGDGIAIPHVRNPIVLHVESPVVSLSFLAKEADFDAVDGQPVAVLFTFLTPTVKTHLALLSRLSYLLRDARFLEAVRAREPAERLLTLARELEAGIR